MVYMYRHSQHSPFIFLDVCKEMFYEVYSFLPWTTIIISVCEDLAFCVFPETCITIIQKLVDNDIHTGMEEEGYNLNPTDV